MGKINDIFKPLYTSKNRYYFITGGRGSLKSSTVHDFVVRLTFEQGEGVLFTRYTMSSAEKSIIPEFIVTIKRLKLEKAFRITKTSIVNVLTGSFVLFSGIKTSSGDQTANLKSISGITCWIIEEGEDYNDEKSFRTIDDSIRTKSKQNRVIWIQNPSTKEHFIYKRWLEDSNKTIDIDGFKVTVSNNSDVTHIHSWFGIAREYLSADWLKNANDAKLTNPTWYYHNYIGGWLETAEGAIFVNYEVGCFDNTLPYCYGQDYGFSVDPTTLIKVAVDNKNKIIYAHEDYYERKQLGTNDIYLINKSRISKPSDLIIGDDHGQQNRLVYDLNNLGLNIIGSSNVTTGTSAMISFALDYKIIITEESTNIKKELRNYCWNDKRAGIPIDNYNHSIDAIMYAFAKLAHLKNNTSNKSISKSATLPPQRL